MGQRELMIRVVRVLDDAGVPFMLTGSFASSLQGAPRSTHDIDLVVDLPPAAVDRLVEAFPPPGFHLDRDALVRAIHTRGMANLLDVDEGDKVDLWMLTDSPFDTSRFARRVPVSLAGVTLSVSTPEDTILQKLAWSRLAGGSERQQTDARRIIEVHGAALDVGYLHAWAARLGVEEDLARLLG